jgi:hypothetical protein
MCGRTPLEAARSRLTGNPTMASTAPVLASADIRFN